MGQIWMHIGSPKTGTTSLQGFLNDNAETLRREGRLNFVQAGRSHIAHNQIASTARMENVAPIFEQICREADSMPNAVHVVSSELLFNLFTARKMGKDMPDEFKARTKVITYLRRQDAYLEALYKQFLKNSRIEPDRQAFLEDGPRRVRYLDTLDSYAQMFGEENIVARPFSSDKLVEGDIVHDFAAQIGLDLTPGLKMSKDYANRTFSAEMSEMLAVLNDNTDFNVREVVRELLAVDHPGTIRSRDVFTRAERRGLMRQMGPENKEIVARYMPDDADFFSNKFLDGAGDPPALAGEELLQQQLKDRVAASEALVIAMGNIQRRKLAEVELAAEERFADTPKQAPAEPDEALPSWYQEIYPGGDKQGWFHKLGDHSASFVERSDEQLVVSFDNLSQAGNDAFAREPWAQKFCADRDCSHLGIYAQTATWFRDATLIDHLTRLRRQGFFKDFKKVAFVGTSMGAFGALSFASLAPGANVVAFSPQTTLDPAMVPWEDRFGKGRVADWSLPFSDAARATSKAGKVYLIYDPFHLGDRLHIERLKGDNLVHLKGFGIGHKSALVLNRMDMLKPVMEAGIDGTLNPADFYRSLRARKDIYLYRSTMEGYLKASGHEERAKRFAAAFKRRKRRQNTDA